MPQILFIHPDQKLTGIYQRHFSPYFSVDSAIDGMSGLRKIRLTKPRIIISEYNLEYMSGLALLSFVRKHPELYANPFIFLTNAPMPEEALGLGATAWLKTGDHDPEHLLHQIYVNHFTKS